MQAVQLDLFDSLLQLEEEQGKVRNVLAEPPFKFSHRETELEEDKSTDIRHEAQANRKIAYDVGTKIGGASKDIAALRKLFMDNPSLALLRQMEEEDAVAAAELVTRDVFFNWFSMEACYEKEVEVKVAYGISLMIRRIPKNANGINREAYINALTLVSDEMKSVRTFKQFDQFYNRLRTMQSYKPSRAKAIIVRTEACMEYLRWETNTSYIAKLQNDLQKETGHLNLIDLYNNYKWDQLGKFYELISDSRKLRTFNTSINKYHSWEAYFKAHPPVTENEEVEVQPKRAARSNKPVWERELPQQPSHNSGIKLPAIKSPEDFRQLFGFRAVEYGNYVNDEVGFKHMNHCAQAYVDLAHILNVPLDSMSLGNQLAMAFGSRGKGRALGHFERGYNVINLTRDKGSLGILAHEFFHAYDRYLKRTTAEFDDGGLVTEGNNLEDLPSDLMDARNMLITTLKEGHSTAFIDVTHCKRTYTFQSKFRDKYEQSEGDLKQFMDRHMNDFDERNERQAEYYVMYNRKQEFLDKVKKKRQQEVRKMAEALSQYHYEMTGEKVNRIPYTSLNTRFFNVAVELDRYKVGKYWSSDCELAARAFEYYISEKMKVVGWRNDYLVCGLDEIYPDGEEGKRIKEAMDLFMKVSLAYLNN